MREREIRNTLDIIRGTKKTVKSAIPHGTTGGYTNHGCRCKRCRKTWAKYHREYLHRSGQIDKHRLKMLELRYAGSGLPLPKSVTCPGCGREMTERGIFVHLGSSPDCKKAAGDTIQHGTPHGYSQCVKRPEGSCDECRAAQRQYRREYREKTGR